MAQGYYGSICLDDLFGQSIGKDQQGNRWVCLDQLKGHHVNIGKNGKVYVNIGVYVNDQEDQYGQIAGISLSQSEQDRKNQVKRVYIGNLKASGGQQQQQPQQQQQQFQPSQQSPFGNQQPFQNQPFQQPGVVQQQQPFQNQPFPQQQPTQQQQQQWMQQSAYPQQGMPQPVNMPAGNVGNQQQQWGGSPMQPSGDPNLPF